MQRLGLPFPILSDKGFSSGRALGIDGPPAGPVAARGMASGGVASGGQWCTLIVDPGRRVVKRIGPRGPGGPGGPGVTVEHALAALAECTDRAGRLTPAPAAAQARVPGDQEGLRLPGNARRNPSPRLLPRRRRRPLHRPPRRYHALFRAPPRRHVPGAQYRRATWPWLPCILRPTSPRWLPAIVSG